MTTEVKPRIKRAASPRMVKAAHLLAKGGSQSEAMRLAGYSEAIAKTPGKVTRTAAFQELMEKIGLTDAKLAQKLHEGLEASRIVVMGKDDDSFADVQPDYAVRHRYLETGLRLKGLGKEAGDVNINFHSHADGQRGKYGI